MKSFWNEYGYLLRYILPCMAMAVILGYCLLDRKRVAAWFGPKAVAFLRRVLMAVLILASLLAVLSYTNAGYWRNGHYLNPWEFFHYYLGSKYAPEIGYTGLYAAALIADDETGLKFKHKKKTIRNLDSGRYRSAVGVLNERQKYKDLFSESRWDEFEQDIVFFKGRLNKSRWSGVLRDKGYNATPAWSTAVGGLLSNRISTANEGGMLFLALLDAVLITAATACVFWAFGLRTALFMIVLLGSHYMMHYSHMKGSFLRTDFAMCLVIAVCMVKKNHYKTAGALMGYAFLSRIFPAVFFFGLGAKCFWDILQTRRLNPKYLKFFLSAAMVVAVLVIASIAYMGGLELWQDFQEKISYHNNIVSPWRVGFKQIFANEWIDYAPHLRRRVYEDHQVIWWSIQAVVLLLSLYVIRGLKDHEALAFSFVPTFFLVAPTYYYYIMLLVPLLFFAPKLETPSRALGMIMMFVTAIAGYIFFWYWKQEFPTYYYLSWMVLAFVLYMMYLAFRETWKRDFPEFNRPSWMAPVLAFGMVPPVLYRELRQGPAIAPPEGDTEGDSEEAPEEPPAEEPKEDEASEPRPPTKRKGQGRGRKKRKKKRRR